MTVDRHIGLLASVLQTTQQLYVQQRLREPRYADPRALNRFEHRVFSQHGEDGITLEILRRIGSTTRQFVEIGAGDGLENNTGVLLVQGWSGLWVDGSADNCRSIRAGLSPLVSSRRLSVRDAWVTRENVATLLDEAGIPTEFDVLSIDVDQNTYWIWEGLARFRPRLVIVEYNAIWPPGLDWVVSYDPKAVWDQTVTFGASLTAYECLGRQFDYALVACDLSGANAFFVRRDCLSSAFCGPYDAATHYQPPAYFYSHPGGYARGLSAYQAVSHARTREL